MLSKKQQAMLAKRIIPCLDIKDGRTVKGVNFVQLRDAGDPVELGARYSEEGADELVFLDITATHEKRKTLAALARDGTLAILAIGLIFAALALGGSLLWPIG